MNANGLNPVALHRFLDTARIHLELIPQRLRSALPATERRNATRLIAIDSRTGIRGSLQSTAA